MKIRWLALTLQRNEKEEPSLYVIDRETFAAYLNGDSTGKGKGVSLIVSWIEEKFPLAAAILPGIKAALKSELRERPDPYRPCCYCGGTGKGITTKRTTRACISA